MKQMTTATYKLFRVKNGYCRFAEVSVAVEERTVDEIVDNIRQPIQWGDGEVDRAAHLDWIDAALVGCEDALVFSRAQGIQGSFGIQVQRVRGAEVDTLPEDVRIASFAAVWEALTSGARPLSLDFQDQRWIVQLP